MKEYFLSYINTRNILIVVLFVLLLGFVFRSCEKSREIANYKHTIGAINDEVKKTKNKLGQNVAQRKAIEIEYKQLQDLYFANNVELAELKKIVKKDTKSATIFSGETRVDTFIDTQIKYAKDSSLIYCSVFNDNWVFLSIESGIDTTLFALIVKNKYQIKQESKREKWYSKKQLVTQVTNLNPYSSTDSVISYTRKEKSTRFGLDLQVGYGFNGPYLGIGVGYRLIEF